MFYKWEITQNVMSSRKPPGILLVLWLYASLLYLDLVTWPAWSSRVSPARRSTLTSTKIYIIKHFTVPELDKIHKLICTILKLFYNLQRLVNGTCNGPSYRCLMFMTDQDWIINNSVIYQCLGEKLH